MNKLNCCTRCGEEPSIEIKRGIKGKSNDTVHVYCWRCWGKRVRVAVDEAGEQQAIDKAIECWNEKNSTDLRKEQPPKRVEYKTMEEIQMSNENELRELLEQRGATEACGDTEKPVGHMDFGEAIRALKAGHKVARSGWNGRGMYLWLKPAAEVKREWCRDPRFIEAIDQNGGESILGLGTICMFTHDSTGRKAVLTGWQATQSDMLYEDWYIVD